MREIDNLARDGAAAWPDLRLTDDIFRRHLARTVEQSDGDETRPLFVGDLFLACCCMHRVPGALEAFDRRYRADIDAALRGIDVRPAFIDEARQRLNVLLFVSDGVQSGKIAQYSGRGPLGSWVGVTVQRIGLRILNEEGRRREVPDDVLLDVFSQDGDPALTHLKQRYCDELRQALYDAFASLSARERLMLRLHFVEHLTMDRVASFYNVHQTTISRQLRDIRERILQHTQKSLQERLKLSSLEFNAVVQLVQSQIDITLSRVFDELENP